MPLHLPILDKVHFPGHRGPLLGALHGRSINVLEKRRSTISKCFYSHVTAARVWIICFIKKSVFLEEEELLEIIVGKEGIKIDLY